MELVLRFLDRKQGAVNREYWGECSSATLTQSVDLRGDKKENKLITSYDCQAITVSFKRKMCKKAWCMCKVVVLPVVLLTSPSSLLFKSSLFSRTKDEDKVERQALESAPSPRLCVEHFPLDRNSSFVIG